MTKIICQNRKARHDYFILDEYEAGMVLLGTEVKSLRLGRANLKDSYAKISNGEVFLHNMHIAQYPFAAGANHDPRASESSFCIKEKSNALPAKSRKGARALSRFKFTLKKEKQKLPWLWLRESESTTSERQFESGMRRETWIGKGEI